MSDKKEQQEFRVNRLKEVDYELLDGFFVDKTFDSDERYREESVLNLNSALFETLLSEIKFKKEQIKQNAILKEEHRLKKEQQESTLDFTKRINNIARSKIEVPKESPVYYMFLTRKTLCEMFKNCDKTDDDFRNFIDYLNYYDSEIKKYFNL